MEMDRKEVLRKRRKPARRKRIRWTMLSEMVEKEESETNVVGSDEMEFHINAMLEKIESFTQLVSELLESGKTMFKQLSDEFEERLIT